MTLLQDRLEDAKGPFRIVTKLRNLELARAEWSVRGTYDAIAACTITALRFASDIECSLLYSYSLLKAMVGVFE